MNLLITDRHMQEVQTEEEQSVDVAKTNSPLETLDLRLPDAARAQANGWQMQMQKHMHA